MTKRQLVKKPKIIVIVGPTASGKSDLAIQLAKRYGGEIISADSRQVYKGMDIGTGKVTKKGQELIRHYLLDVADPKKQFTVSDFEKLAEKAIKEISAKGKIPVIVGGTGFYIDILLGRMATAEVPPNKKLRANLEKLSVEHLFKRLRKLDPRRAETIDVHNKRRLVRALEIILSTGKPVPKLESSIKYQVLWIGLKPKDLEKRIKKRLDARLKRGMAREVKKLLRQGISHKRLYDFGLEYRWLSEYLKGKVSYQEMKEKLLRDIIGYSKRQMTWFKRNKEIHWVKNQKEMLALVNRFLHP